MLEQLNKIKTLLSEKGLDYDKSEINLFITNWMPESNYDYQQEYFLMNLLTSLYEILALNN